MSEASIITLDFETYYAKGFSFSNLTTEEYISHPDFEVIGYSAKVDDGPAVWVSGTREELGKALRKLPWRKASLLCHNTMFDGAMLAWLFDIYPSMYLDTLCMGRAIHGVDVGGSLASLASRYQLGEKGTEVVEAMGKRRLDFTSEELARYGAYCINDVELTHKLFAILSQDFPEDEIKLIDMTLRMFITPGLKAEVDVLEARLAELREEKSQLLRSLVETLDCQNEPDPEEAVRKKLSSNQQFAKILESYGVKAPMKPKKPTPKNPNPKGMTYALAKNDEEFIALHDHENPTIQQLCAVRTNTKSTIEESRIQRFIDVAKRHDGWLPIPLKYYGAHTGRWAGSDKVNFQNLPSRDAKKKTLKAAVVAPEGHSVINCDSSQIEARVLAWLAGETDVVEAFAKGRDVYSEFATKIYKRPISKKDPIERFVGKTCIAEGTLILSHHGWKPIESVTTEDLLWDGQEWVCHQGLLNNGIKSTLNLCGAWLTPDHQVWSGTQWLEAQSVVADEDTLYQALDTGAENLPSQATLLAPEAGSAPLWSDATAMKPSTELTTITSKISEALAALCAPRKHRLQNAIGCTAKQWRMMTTGLAYSIVSLQQSLDVTLHPTGHTSTMVSAAYGCAPSGALTERSSCGTSRPSTVGTTRLSRWIGLMWMGIMNRGISASYRGAITSTTSARSQTLKRVYDILNSGSRNRFTILTEAGPLVVHNCILGLGYGTGAAKLKHTLKTQPPSADLPLEECESIVKLYRETNSRIPDLWRECDRALSHLVAWPVNEEGNPWKPYYLGEQKAVLVTKDGLRLPNGLHIRYNNLRLEDGSYIYDSRKGVVKIWGGAVVENIVQALARIVVGQQMLALADTYRPVLTVHDAAVCVVPDDEVEEAVKYIVEVMSTPPDWATGLPVACEAKFARSYGHC